LKRISYKLKWRWANPAIMYAHNSIFDHTGVHISCLHLRSVGIDQQRASICSTVTRHHSAAR
jgi:hypothetical protein